MDTSKTAKARSPIRRAESIIHYILLLGCVGLSALHAQSLSVSATAGKEFYISFLKNTLPAKLQLKVIVEKSCYITAKYNHPGAATPYWNGWNNTPVTPGIYMAEVSYDDMVSTATGTTSKTMTITATENIRVYAVNYANASTDASIILPVSAWGSTYYLATGKPAGTLNGAAYSIVAKENNTEVILDDGTLIDLQKNEVYHFYAPAGMDLTGQAISSLGPGPVAVFSGAPLAVGAGDHCSTSLGAGSENHVYEQLWSVNHWGKEFFVWPVHVGQGAANWGGIIGIVAYANGTQVTVSGDINGGTPITYTLNQGEKQYVCQVMSGLTRITSNQSVMVFTLLPDAAITWIPPVSRRVTQVVLSPLVLPDHTNLTHHVVEFLIPSRYRNRMEIKENGVIVSNSNYTVTTSNRFPDWNTIRRELPNADIRIDVSCPGGLQAFMYGYGQAESYGYLVDVGTNDYVISHLPDNVVETDCAVPVSVMQWSFDPNPIRLGNNEVSVYQTPYVGDLDNDGNVEIVVAKSYEVGGFTNEKSWCYAANGVLVFDQGNHTSRTITTPIFTTAGIGQIGLAKPNAASPGLIVIAAMDGYLYAFDKAGNSKWTGPGGRSDAPYTTYNVPGDGSGSDYKTASILFADFNGDGYTEIVTGDRIFDLETGKLLLDCGFLRGLKIREPCISIVDVTREGNPELVWGGHVYSVLITNRTGTAGNYHVILKYADAAGMSNLPNTSVVATIPADFDLDGKVDILAYGTAYFYIYDPSSGAIKISRPISPGDQGNGIPFVGDIDGDKYPELMYGEDTSPYHNILAWKIYTRTTSSPNIMWRRKTFDQSRATGLTLFDFDQNGTYEILYRDQEYLYIFNGTNQTTVNTEIVKLPCFSGTIGEYPVTADVDNDGEAEILVTGALPGNPNTRGYLYIFNPGTGARWAPARKVWNQYAYNVVNINEDLTVPLWMCDVATIMAGKDSILGTTDDVHPYNGFLKQSTMINRYGNMVMYAPDMQFTSRPAFLYHSDGDSLQIVFSVVNTGKSAFVSPLYVSLFLNGVTTADKLRTLDFSQAFNPGVVSETRTIVFQNFMNTFGPNDRLILRLNDRGNNRYEGLECNTGNNTDERRVSDILQTNNDMRTVQRYYWTEIDVLANDALPDGLFAGPFSLLDSVVRQPVEGVLSVTGTGRNSRLVYLNSGTDSLPDHVDSLVYRFRVKDPDAGYIREFHATAYIYILEEIHGAATCRDRPFTAVLRERPAGIGFVWFTVADTLPAVPPTGASHTFGTVTGDTSLLVQPVNISISAAPWDHVGEFPPGRLTIHAAASPGSMRWTGLENNDWHNPANWVETVTEASGRTYETPVAWSPSACTDVVISSGMSHYPELTDSAWCRIITVRDRALLKNPHVLNYAGARVELKLKATERDRFVMWSAPLCSMYSGDYHFKDSNGQPNWGDVYMNYFQQAHPAGGGAQVDMFTATFGEPGDPLGLGKAFNLYVTSTSQSRDRAWMFPQSETEYHPAGSPPVYTPRPAAHRFITDSVRPDASGRFDLPVYGDLTNGNLVQVVNPYLAWLHADSFLRNNSAQLAPSGYLVWDGRVNSGFTAVKFDRTDMRYLYTGPSNFAGMISPEYIAPLQSFFVAKSTTAGITRVKMSPAWTTTRLSGSGSLRASEAESGVLHIRAVQGSRTAYAALHFDRQAGPEYNSHEDVRALFYAASPFSLYVLTPLYEPMAISADGEYRMHTTALGLSLAEGGETTLEFTGLERFGYNVYLIDRGRDNLEIDLRVTPSYTFTAVKPSGVPVFELNDRFVLRMEYTDAGNAPEESARPEVTVTDGTGLIRVRSFSGLIEQIDVYNALGMQVYSATPDTDTFDLPVTGAQTYLVKVRIAGGETVRKVIVK